MAEILPLIPSLDGAGAERLAAGLAAAFAAGADLGPRGPQIRALGLSLHSLAGAVRDRLADLEAALAREAIPTSGHSGLRTLLGEVERLAAAAASHGAAEAASTDGTQAARPEARGRP